MKKRIVTLVMAICLLICIMPFSASAETAPSSISFEERIEQVSSKYLRPYNVSTKVIANGQMPSTGSIDFELNIYPDATYMVKIRGRFVTGQFSSYDAETDTFIDDRDAHYCAFSVVNEAVATLTFQAIDEADGVTELELPTINVVNIKSHTLWDTDHPDNFDGTYVYAGDSIEIRPDYTIKNYPMYKNSTAASLESIRLTINGPYYTYEFEFDGEPVTLVGYINRGLGGVIMGSFETDEPQWTSLNAVDGFDMLPNRFGVENLMEIRASLHDGDDLYLPGGAGIRGSRCMYLTKVEEPEEPEPQEYDVNIIGNGLSNTSEYMVTVIGKITGTFDEGVTTLTNTEIQALNLSITTYNLTNGANRVMTVSTVEGIKVTVANGSITNVEIKGRAQTNPGNFDRYTVNCSTF